jgi:hypothetical protein
MGEDYLRELSHVCERRKSGTGSSFGVGKEQNGAGGDRDPKMCLLHNGAPQNGLEQSQEVVRRIMESEMSMKDVRKEREQERSRKKTDY